MLYLAGGELCNTAHYDLPIWKAVKLLSNGSECKHRILQAGK